MAEQLKSEGKKDLLPRQDMINIAVSFLRNPNVEHRPVDAKIAFLKKKGLTDTEISVAFNKIKYEAATGKDKQFVNAYPLPPYQPPNSFWFQLRSYSSSFVSFAVAVYVLHRFYKSYIEPWLFGTNSERSELSALKQQLIELNNSVSRLVSTVASLEEVVNNQMLCIDRVSLNNVESVPKSVKDIQDEVSSVKSLLLNRFSFPAPPSVGGTTTENKIQSGDSKDPLKVVTIPKWQLHDSEEEKSKGDSKDLLEENEDKEIYVPEFTYLENGLNSVGAKIQDQENNVEVLGDKNVNFKPCFENNLSIQNKILSENFKKATESLVRKVEEKKPNDSGTELHNYLYNSKSTYQTNEKINDHESAMKS